MVSCDFNIGYGCSTRLVGLFVGTDVRLDRQDWNPRMLCHLKPRAATTNHEVRWRLTLELVAMTRPKRHLCIIGDSETVSRGSAYLKRWIKFLEEESDLRYPNLDELGPG